MIVRMLAFALALTLGIGAVAAEKNVATTVVNTIAPKPPLNKTPIPSQYLREGCWEPCYQSEKARCNQAHMPLPCDRLPDPQDNADCVTHCVVYAHAQCHKKCWVNEFH